MPTKTMIAWNHYQLYTFSPSVKWDFIITILGTFCTKNKSCDPMINVREIRWKKRGILFFRFINCVIFNTQKYLIYKFMRNRSFHFERRSKLLSFSFFYTDAILSFQMSRFVMFDFTNETMALLTIGSNGIDSFQKIRIFKG